MEQVGQDADRVTQQRGKRRPRPAAGRGADQRQVLTPLAGQVRELRHALGTANCIQQSHLRATQPGQPLYLFWSLSYLIRYISFFPGIPQLQTGL